MRSVLPTSSCRWFRVVDSRDRAGDAMSFLWHIPISDEERDFKQQYGSDALLDRMQEVGLPYGWPDEEIEEMARELMIELFGFAL